MGTGQHQKILIIGCGRVGVELALAIAQQAHSVTVVDTNPRSFDRLGPDFSGRTVQGEALDREALIRAGIEEADGFAAVTRSDSSNLVAARIARDIFHVPHVVARVYNPRRSAIYEKFNLPIVASSSWGAHRIEQLLLHPGLQSIHSAGNGEVQLYEISVPEAWSGRKLTEVIPTGKAIPATIARAGRGMLPTPDMVLQTHDVLQVSATVEGATAIRERLHAVEGK